MRDKYFARFVLSVCTCPSPHPPKGKAHAEAPLSAAFCASRSRKTNNNYNKMCFICMPICISVFRRNFTCFSLMIQGIRPRRSVPRIEIALGICISWVSILKKCQFRIAVRIESSPTLVSPLFWYFEKIFRCIQKYHRSRWWHQGDLQAWTVKMGDYLPWKLSPEVKPFLYPDTCMHAVP